MKKSDTFSLMDILVITIILVLTFIIGNMSSDPVQFYTTYAVILSVISNQTIHKHIRNSEK